MSNKISNSKKYLKWINELQSDDGHMLPILTNCKVIHHRLTYWTKFYIQGPKKSDNKNFRIEKFI